MSKKYDVFAMGNAIVDIVCPVEESYLTKHNIEKGQMTLVEEDRQSELIIDLDQTKTKNICGGSASNTTVLAAQLGAKTYYSCTVANDLLGKLFIDNLKCHQVDTNLDTKSLPSGLTGRCLVLTTPDTERTMNTHLGITATYNKALLDFAAISDAEYCYIEGYLITSPNGKEAMIEAKQYAQKVGTKVALTFSDPAMANFFRKDLKEVIANRIDLLFCNEEEAQLYTEKDDLNTAIEQLSKVCKHLVITLGKKGAIIVFDGQTHKIPVSAVHAVDSNGAGDAFAGAYLYGITNGLSNIIAGQLACDIAAGIVSQFGARMQTSAIQKIKNETLS